MNCIIGPCNPSKEAFLFWDLITGNAPVNEYSILGYQMLLTAYMLALFLIPLAGLLFYELLKIIEDIVPGKFKCHPEPADRKKER